MYVGGKEYQKRIESRFVGLDLHENMFVGGVQDFRVLSRSIGQRSGFIGATSVFS
jgi:hypothetical protein